MSGSHSFKTLEDLLDVMITLRQSNIAMENGSFEDVFPIKHGDIPASYVSLPEGNLIVSASPQNFV